MRGPYTFLIEGSTFTPSDFGKLHRICDGQSIRNPDQLYEDAIRQAERVAFDLVSPGQSVEVRIVGNVGSGAAKKPVEASYVVAYESAAGGVVSLSSPSYKWGRDIRRATR